MTYKGYRVHNKTQIFSYKATLFCIVNTTTCLRSRNSLFRRLTVVHGHFERTFLHTSLSSLLKRITFHSLVGLCKRLASVKKCQWAGFFRVKSYGNFKNTCTKFFIRFVLMRSYTLNLQPIFFI